MLYMHEALHPRLEDYRGTTKSYHFVQHLFKHFGHGGFEAIIGDKITSL